MKQKLILTIPVLILLAFSVWLLFFNDSEDTKIRRSLAEIAQLAGKSGDKAPFDEVADFHGMERRFASRVHVSASRYADGDFPTKELIQRFIAGRKFLTSFQVSIHDIAVTFDEETGTAEAIFTLFAQGKSKMSEGFREAFDCRVVFIRNEDGDWVVRTAEATPVLTKDAPPDSEGRQSGNVTPALPPVKHNESE